jgi:hypothetical protein
LEFKGITKKTKLTLRAVSSPSVSSSNEANIILDANDMKLKASINGGSYAEIGGGGGSALSLLWFTTTDGISTAMNLSQVTQVTNRYLMLSSMYVPGNLTAKLIRLAFYFTASGANTYTATLGLYTGGGGTWTLVKTATVSFNGASSLLNSKAYFVNISSSAIQNNSVVLVAGSSYLIGVLVARSNASGDAFIIGKEMSGPIASIRGLIADGTAGTRFPAPFVGGQFSVTTAALPSSISANQIKSALGGFVVPYILFTSIDPETGASL